MTAYDKNRVTPPFNFAELTQRCVELSGYDVSMSQIAGWPPILSFCHESHFRDRNALGPGSIGRAHTVVNAKGRGRI